MRQMAVITGVGRTLAEVEQSVVEQARSLADEEWTVSTVTLGEVMADDAEDMHTENGTRRYVRVWRADARVLLTRGE